MRISGGARRPSLLVVGALLLGLSGVGTVDGLAVKHKLAEARRQAAHEQLLRERTQYADALRGVAKRVYTDVLPVQHILDTLMTPHAGDIYAARDALANDASVESLRADLHRLDALRAPAGYGAAHRHLRAALEHMADVVAKMRKRADVRNPVTLNSDLVDSDNTGLISSEGAWRTALRDLYRTRHESPPATPMTGSAKHPPESLVGWVFEADRRCIVADVASIPLVRRLKTNSFDTAAMRRGALISRRLVRKLMALPVPRVGRDQLRQLVLSRLRSLDALSRAVSDAADAIDARNAGAAGRAVDRIRTTHVALRALARGFGHYHAVACQNFVGPAGGGTQRALPA